MRFKKLVSMNIAIIGNTDIAAIYAKGFVSAGHEVFMACSEAASPGYLADRPEDVHLCTISAAAAVADLIILASHPKEVREVSYWLGDVRRKVIIDATANVHSPEDELVKTVCAIKAITGSPHVVKVFNTMGYEAILKPLFNGVEVNLIILTDSKKAREITKIMAVELGLSIFYDFGNSDAIPLFNEMTKCWRRLQREIKISPFLRQHREIEE